MSGEIRKQEDPLLRQLLDSAELDEAPDGAEDAMLAALGLGTVGVATALVSTSKAGATAVTGSTLPAVATLAKLAPFAVKLLGVLGIAGLGAVAWHAQKPATEAPPRGSEPPVPMQRPSMIPPASANLPLAAHEDVLPLPKAPLPRLEPPAARAANAMHEAAPSSAAIAPPTPAPGVALELETRLLAAARNALSLGDKATARDYLRQYEREVQDGVLQREADILWNRAR